MPASSYSRSKERKADEGNTVPAGVQSTHLVFSSAGRSINIYRTVILPVVLCGYETWSRTLREEHKLRVFEKRH